MRLGICALVLALPSLCFAQSQAHDISPAQLQSIIDLPLGQAVQQREIYKRPLNSAYHHQMALAAKDCQAVQGQQPYNICTGHADQQVDQDFAVFYNNLQLLCHNRDQLATLQASEKAWELYKQSAMHSTHASWPDGTAAPGVTGQVYLSLLRDRMRELYEIYTMNISQ